MPSLAPTQPAEPVSYFDAHQWGEAPHAQGIEGKKVSERAGEAFRHWSERAEVLLMRRKDMEEVSYEHVPPNRVFYVKTRYVYVGKGLPGSFHLDDE